jgi:hypothetical protein
VRQSDAKFENLALHGASVAQNSEVCTASLLLALMIENEVQSQGGF